MSGLRLIFRIARRRAPFARKATALALVLATNATTIAYAAPPPRPALPSITSIPPSDATRFQTPKGPFISKPTRGTRPNAAAVSVPMEGAGIRPPRLAVRVRSSAHGKAGAPAAPVSVRVPATMRGVATRVLTPQSVTLGAVSATGEKPWWTFEGSAVPGVGPAEINVANQNLFLQSTDLRMTHRWATIEFTRVYNSLSQHDFAGTDGSQPSNYGNGWTNNLDAHVAVNSGQNGNFGISVYAGDGARYDYLPTDSTETVFTPPPGQHATLTTDSTHCNYYWNLRSGTTLQFHTPVTDRTKPCAVTPRFGGQGGRLVTVYGRNQRSQIGLNYSWDGGIASSAATLNQITMVVDGVTTAATLTFANFGSVDSNGTACSPVKATRLLQTLAWMDGTVTTYKYDCAGNLVEVDKPSNQPGAPCASGGSGCSEERYAYDVNHFMTAAAGGKWSAGLSDPTNLTTGSKGSYVVMTPVAGTAAIATLAHVGEINPTIADGISSGPVQPSMPTGNVTYRTATITTTGTSATWSDTDGHKNVYTFDSSGLGRVAQTTYSTGATTQLSNTSGWDNANNRVYQTDLNGNRTDFAYDADGNRIASAQPAIKTLSQGTMQLIRPTALSAYDQYDNLIAYCDANWVTNNGHNWDGVSTPYACPATIGTASSPGPTVYKWSDGSGGYEPFGELTEAYTPTGYHLHYAYSGAAEGGSSGNAGVDFGSVTTVTGDSVTQPSGTFSPTLQIVYDQYGSRICANSGAGWAVAAYDTMERVKAVGDADDASVQQAACPKTPGIAGSTISQTFTYMQNGAVATVQNPPELAAGVSTSYTYDRDGNERTATTHFGCTPGASCSAGVTQKWYDGDDRLVEVMLPTDASDGLTPWPTRYLYDLTQNGTNGASNQLTAGGVTTQFAAHGNLFSVQTYLPSNSYVSQPGWRDQKGWAYDNADRPTASYILKPSHDGSQTLLKFSVGYDSTPSGVTTSGNNGLLSSIVDSLGYYENFGYDALDRMTNTAYTNSSTDARSITYDPVGRVLSSTKGAVTNSYSYTPDGLLKESDVTGISSPLQLTYGYYSSGLRSSLSVKQGTAFPSTTDLVDYQYRNDGLLSSMAVNYATGGRPTQTFSFAYTSAGRLSSQTDPLSASPSVSESYDSYGRVANYGIPAGTYGFSSSSYDDEGEPMSYSAYTPSQTVSNTFNVRGELTQFVQQTGAATTSIDFDGLLLPQTNVVGQQTIDPLSATQLAATTNAYSTPPMPATPNCPTTTRTSSSWQFDGAGRESNATLSALQQNANSIIPCPETIVQTQAQSTMSYDTANHLTQVATTGTTTTNGSTVQDIPVTMSYQYDGAEHVRQISGDPSRSSVSGYSPTSSESVFWDGNDVLFTTDANGKLDDLKIGAFADITAAGSNAGLTVWDRELDGQQISYHNASGVGPWKAPTTWTSGGYNLTSPDQFGILFTTKPRLDALTDLHTTFVGIRTLDEASLNFTTPDASSGGLADPLSLKPYVYAADNPLQYSDPSGNDVDPNCPPSCLTASPPQSGVTIGGNPITAIIGVFAAIGGSVSGFFKGLFGGGGHKHAPPPPPPQAPSYPEDWDAESIQAVTAMGHAGDAMEGTLVTADVVLTAAVTAPIATEVGAGMAIEGAVGGAELAGVGGAEGAAEATSYEELVANARLRYPSKAGKIEWHHIQPKYLRGPEDGPLAPLDAAYHQMITNEFRALAPYGREPLSPEDLAAVMQKVYGKLPLPPGYTY